MSKKPYTPRERGILTEGRRIERRVQERCHAAHRIVIRAYGQIVIDSTIGDLLAKERKRDGPGAVCSSCTTIELPLKVAQAVGADETTL